MTYEVVRRLGRGGMGVVDLAVDGDGQPVALKRLSFYGTPDEIAKARQRFRREAEVLRHLDHPGIVRLLEVVEEGDDVVLVVRYLPGGTLQERVSAGGPLHPNQVGELADRLLDALATAHRQGVVHRDIKPANVLFDDDGRPQLVDFGVAIARDHTVGLTASEMVVGTPGFMAPEQARGEPAGAASDVFSLGATLLFAATGRGPYGEGDVQGLMWRAAQGRVDRLPPSLPLELRRRLAPMLEREAARRPTAAAARGGPAGTWPRTGLGHVVGRRRPWLLLAVVASVLALVAVAAVLLSGGDDGDGESAIRTTQPPVTTEPCSDLPYQPCGQPEPAAGTDGRECRPGFADYDQRPANGCEAEDDGLDGRTLDQLGGVVIATLVPADDTDEFPFAVEDRGQLLCDGSVTITLAGPAGMNVGLEVLLDHEVVGEAVSADGREAVVEIDEPSCGSDDSGTLLARIGPVGERRVGAPYRLEVDGTF